MKERPYVLMELVAGKTLNELAYMNPEVLEENRIRIAFQLGMHAAFSYVFGVKDGYQSNYLFDPQTRSITRVDNERFLVLPEKPENTLEAGDEYAQDIAACELDNLKYIPSFRNGRDRENILKAFNTGFLEKYSHIKERKDRLLGMVEGMRNDTLRVRYGISEVTYEKETKKMKTTVEYLMDQNPREVLARLYMARSEIGRG
jgi:hypothetical protein